MLVVLGPVGRGGVRHWGDVKERNHVCDGNLLLCDVNVLIGQQFEAALADALVQLEVKYQSNNQ